jgi:hypothetical protein
MLPHIPRHPQELELAPELERAVHRDQAMLVQQDKYTHTP